MNDLPLDADGQEQLVELLLAQDEANCELAQQNAFLNEIISRRDDAGADVLLLDVLDIRCERQADATFVEISGRQMNGTKCQLFAHYEQPGKEHGRLMMVLRSE